MKYFTMVGMLAVQMVTAGVVVGQTAPYDVFPEVQPPYYRIRYEAGNSGTPQDPQLQFSVQFTLWMPPGVERLKGIVVHQHGCGEGSCKSGLTGAFDLHWQALAAKHDCALLAPAYEQPQAADCGLWCDPRNGSDARFQEALSDLGTMTKHPEMATVPWALWGHSGGATWAGIMTILHPERVGAAWLRSGAPLVEPLADRPTAKTIELPKTLAVPMMMNLGTKEGVSVTDGRFSGVWPKVQKFVAPLRERGGLIGVAVDPITSHECGNQRYLAIPWMDECLQMRLPASPGQPLRLLNKNDGWLAEPLGKVAAPVSSYGGDASKAIWLPSERVAKLWMQYVKDTGVADETPPPAPSNVTMKDGKLTWEATADLESGIAKFIIQHRGKRIAEVPSDAKNRFGRPLFQGLQYSDTPQQPLVKMEFELAPEMATQLTDFRVIAVNTLGLESHQSGQAAELN